VVGLYLPKNVRDSFYTFILITVDAGDDQQGRARVIPGDI
jgi:hypothetical protein